ncbi:MAG: 50S ribosomal protein L3 N(5)-glutamine methyltransferase [Burkholderiaceae bacterium]|nr:50S ribosomal protein L3 N(5)-glutamine methyltransferase [Burkholderiaceae bacterium]
MQLHEIIGNSQAALEAANLSYGHGTNNARDEAIWLVLWSLELPLDTDIDEPECANRSITPSAQTAIETLIAQRISTRKPAAYLTRQAWLQGVPFYVDERAIVPRSLIAEALAYGHIDDWLPQPTRRVLDLCTGNASLAVLSAMAYPDAAIDAADLSQPALEVAAINVAQHDMGQRIRLLTSDGLANVHGPYDLVLCNPPYVNQASMEALPAEYLAEPALALAGGTDGMDFIRPLMAQLPDVLSAHGVLVLEIGNERDYFERAFPDLNPIWLPTSAGDDHVLLLTKDMLATSEPTTNT